MNWFYVEAGQQAGPVEEAVLDGLFRAGRIQADTLVWREGLANWQPYREVRPMAAAPGGEPPVGSAPPVVDQVLCLECRRSFPRDQAIQYGAGWVCAGCKPLFLQRLREGAPLPTRGGRRPLPVNPEELEREVLSREFSVDIGHCVSRGWQLVMDNFWLTVGTSFLVMLAMQASGMIPFLGLCIGLVVNGPLMGGLYAFFLKLIRGEPATVGDGFAGFSKSFGSLLAVFILMCLLVYVGFIPAGIYGVATGQFDRQTPDAVMFALAFAGLLVAAYFGIALIFALPLAIDLELGPIAALQVSRRVMTRRWFSFFGLAVVCGLIMIVGLFALCLGLLVAVPVAYAAMMYAYEDVFGYGSVEAKPSGI
jgi:hypothetical protein